MGSKSWLSNIFRGLGGGGGGGVDHEDEEQHELESVVEGVGTPRHQARMKNNPVERRSSAK